MTKGRRGVPAGENRREGRESREKSAFNSKEALSGAAQPWLRGLGWKMGTGSRERREIKLGKRPAPPNPKSGVCGGWESRQCGITLNSGGAVQWTFFGVFVDSQGFPIPQFRAPHTPPESLQRAPLVARGSNKKETILIHSSPPPRAPLSPHRRPKIAALFKPFPPLKKNPKQKKNHKKPLGKLALTPGKRRNFGARCPQSTHPGLAAADGPGPDGSRLLVATEDFGDAAVGDAELPGDHAGPDAVVSHLHDLVADVVGQRAPVDENPSELVHPALAQWGGHCEGHGEKNPTQKKRGKVKIEGKNPVCSSPHLPLLSRDLEV